MLTSLPIKSVSIILIFSIFYLSACTTTRKIGTPEVETKTETVGTQGVFKLVHSPLPDKPFIKLVYGKAYLLKKTTVFTQKTEKRQDTLKGVGLYLGLTAGGVAMMVAGNAFKKEDEEGEIKPIGYVGTAVVLGTVFGAVLFKPKTKKGSSYNYEVKEKVRTDLDVEYGFRPSARTQVEIKVNGKSASTARTDWRGEITINVLELRSVAGTHGELRLDVQASDGTKDSFTVPTSFFAEYDDYLKSLKPAQLTLRPSFSDKGSFRANQILEGAEKGELIVKITNSGAGRSMETVLHLSQSNAFVSLEHSLQIGTLEPGDSRRINIPISAALGVQDGEATITIQAKEKRGYDSRPVQLVIPVKALARPRLSITSYKINDGQAGRASGNGNGIAENNETIELQVFIKNTGVGPAYGTELKLSSINAGMEEIQSSQSLGDILPNQTIQGNLVFRIPRRFSGSQLNFQLSAVDKLGASPIRKNYRERLRQRAPVLVYDWRILDTRGIEVSEVSNGSSYFLEVRPRNEGKIAANDVQMQLSTRTSVNWQDAAKKLGRLEANSLGTPQRVRLELPRSFSNSSLSVNMQLTQADFSGVTDELTIPVQIRSPRLIVLETVSTSNGDAIIEKGENVEVTLLVQNQGDLSAENVRVALRLQNPAIDYKQDVRVLGTILMGGNASAKFSFFVKGSAPTGPLPLQVAVSQADNFAAVRKTLKTEIREATPEVVRVQGKEAEVTTKRFVVSPTSQPPAVFVLLPGGGRVFENTVKLEIHVQDDKPLLGVKPEIRVNGVLTSEQLGLRGIGIKERQGAKSEREITFHRMVELEEGENMVSISVRDSDNEITTKDIKVTYLTKRTDVWALIVGVREYQDSSLNNLNYTDRDATAFYDFLRSPAGGEVPKENSILLLNEKATQANILGKLSQTLRKAGEDDLIILYFALHGMIDENGNELYFLGYDSDSQNLIGTAIAKIVIDQQLAMATRKNKVVMIVDACHSGSFGQPTTLAMRGAGRASATNRLLAKIAEAQNGLAILTASSASEFSREDSKWGGGHGVFTYYLLEGLKGKADRDGDKYVTTQEIAEYVKNKVRRATDGIQNPEIVDRGYDLNLPLAVVR